MREHSILELLGKILAVVGVIALILLVIFSERAEKQEALAPTATLIPTETPMPTETIPEPTEITVPEEEGVIELPFVPAKKKE